jgi:cytochrome c
VSTLARCAAGLAFLLIANAVFAGSATRPAAAVDIKNGAAVYARCVACHALAYDRTGPRHCGLLGRRAGTVSGFQYSEAMKGSGIVWTPKTLDVFLSNPFKTVPGTSMGYAGVSDPSERRDLIAYIQAASKSEECRKATR